MGQGTEIMTWGTAQDSGGHAKRPDYKMVTFADGRQSVDGCARILRIMLPARMSCPYPLAQNDVRGILLDSYC